MNKKLILFLSAYLAWCLLDWVPDDQHLLVGFLVAGVVALVVGDLFAGRYKVIHRPQRYVLFVFEYIPILLWEVFKANIDVAYRVLHPALPIRPGIVRITTELRSDLALTFLANSITLTPGTICVDVDRGMGVLYVHWIDVKSEDPQVATKLIAGRFEKVLKKIFDDEGNGNLHGK